ncbi:hypothetical protein [Ensifer sp. ENS11]|uniref:hypothetical protein n=2 Tax=unclassified Ensifer TaxID=2633371 RepID=UPI00177BC8E1|nr:hypothetical protein [Ensifer sp. ENS11]MBD9489224.1 hypothetical protein [Ensifer sp. ENS11]
MSDFFMTSFIPQCNMQRSLPRIVLELPTMLAVDDLWFIAAQGVSFVAVGDIRCIRLSS